MKEPSKEQIKERAKFLRQVLKEKHKIDLPHGHALEVLAKVFGFNDWNTASALSPNNSTETQTTVSNVASTNKELPIAAKLQTAGELADFFAKFDREKKVVVNEYKGVDGVSDPLAGTTTSVCSLTYDYEIQTETEVRLELNTEIERNFQLKDFGKSSNQSFDQTEAGRSQRRVKYLHMQNSFWTPKTSSITGNK